jgi:NAD(P)-dependent dehydrogenase (short-subunit alcohol dehydrogenase family)
MGKATAQRLVGEGMKVCVVDIDMDAARAVAEPMGAFAVQCDVSDAAQVDAAFASCVEQFGRVDLAHLNAGVGLRWSGDIGELDIKDYQRSVGVNLDGVVFGARAAVRAMRARSDGGEGAIIATASIAGVMPFHPEPVYTLGKHGVVGLVRAIAPNLAAEGIAVHALCPGTTATGMVAEEHQQMMGRIGVPVQPPENVAEAVVVAATAPLSMAGTCWIVQADTPPYPFEFAVFDGPDKILNVHR